MRCTNATAAALGAPSRDTIVHGSDLLSHLSANGLRWSPVGEPDSPWIPWTGTLGAFRRQYTSGSYVVMTSGHAMALIDGQLTDTADGTNRRRVFAAYKVTR